MLAIEKEAVIFENVPEEFKTEEVCLLAIEKEAFYIFGIPQKIKTADFYLELFRVNNEALQFAFTERNLLLEMEW